MASSSSSELLAIAPPMAPYVQMEVDEAGSTNRCQGIGNCCRETAQKTGDCCLDTIGVVCCAKSEKESKCRIECCCVGGIGGGLLGYQGFIGAAGAGSTGAAVCCASCYGTVGCLVANLLYCCIGRGITCCKYDYPISKAQVYVRENRSITIATPHGNHHPVTDCLVV